MVVIKCWFLIWWWFWKKIVIEIFIGVILEKMVSYDIGYFDRFCIQIRVLHNVNEMMFEVATHSR